MSLNVKEEAKKICELLHNQIPRVWDGKKAILELKDANYQWRQMEWIGWYFEFKSRKILLDNIGGSSGPRYGKTQFDYKGTSIWDFKVHIEDETWTIVNDKEAIDICIRDYGGVGLILVAGNAEYDDEKRTFQDWHEQLKGGKSDYELERIKRNAPSRKRKTSFVLKKIGALWLNSELIAMGIKEQWMGYFQKGMRNANGSPRRTKYKIDVERVSDYVRILQLELI